MNLTASTTPLAARWRGVSKRFGNVGALVDFDLDLRVGEVLAMVGANGAGKTTAIAALLGQIGIDRGEIIVLGQPTGSTTARAQIGVMLQQLSLPSMLSVAEQLRYQAALYPNPMDWRECLRQTGLSELAERRYGKLSGGQQRRVQFALALLGQPRLLVLDEPTVALDPLAREEFWQHVAGLVRGGMSVLLTSHQMEEAEAVADRIAVVHGGRVLAAEPVAELRARAGCQQISCRTTLDEPAMLALSGVHRVQRNGQRSLIYTQSAEATVRELLRLDAGLSELEITRPGLNYSLQTLLAAA